ncbi:hypothetical protein PM082_019591 [Marasmius tenuissimus]|nr:hypothetical protein PM082_019591 [Marasmius tenuissimus]
MTNEHSLSAFRRRFRRDDGSAPTILQSYLDDETRYSPYDGQVDDCQLQKVLESFQDIWSNDAHRYDRAPSSGSSYITGYGRTRIRILCVTEQPLLPARSRPVYVEDFRRTHDTEG